MKNTLELVYVIWGIKIMIEFSKTKLLKNYPVSRIVELDFADPDLSEEYKEKIEASLNEKELLLKEIHHRVKNNMQLISSLLNLQSSYLNDEDARNAISESQKRIRSISLVHESLYLSDNLSSINFKEYIKGVVMGLISNYNSQINVNYNIEKIRLNIETAIPCGLIINEIVTNAIKHAFTNNEGLISIQFTRVSDKFKLIISDNGVGLPESLFNGKDNSLGLQLVKMLVDQLEAELNIDNSDGTTFKIVFEELNYKKRV